MAPPVSIECSILSRWKGEVDGALQLGVTRSQAMASVSKSTLGHGLSVKVDFWPWPQIHFDTVAMARTPL